MPLQQEVRLVRNLIGWQGHKKMFSSSFYDGNTNQSRTVKDRNGNAALGHVARRQGLLFSLLRVCWE